MKLYYTIAPNDAGPWQVPGKQDKGAARVDVPSSPLELAAWLNERRVGRVPAIAAEPVGERTEPTPAGERFWELGESTKEPPRYVPKFHGSIGTADFVPVAHSAEIDRLLRRCPKCHGGDVANVQLWIGEASIDDLERVLHAITDRLKADKEEERA